jgi:hypothetical protein
MFEAIWQDDEKTVRDTFDYRNVDTPDAHGVRPLQVACLKTYPDFAIVSYLLGEGASIDSHVAPGLRLIDALRASVNPYQLEILPLLERVELKDHLEETLPPVSDFPESEPVKI